jgi:hypothetical protein
MLKLSHRGLISIVDQNLYFNYLGCNVVYKADYV